MIQDIQTVLVNCITVFAIILIVNQLAHFLSGEVGRWFDGR